MKHGEVRDRLGRYLEGDLGLQQRALVDAHLDACPNCAAELNELRGTIGLLRSIPDVDPPVGLSHRVMARVQAGEAQPTLRVRLVDGLDLLLRSRPFALAAAAGAVTLALWTPGWLRHEGKPEPAALSPTASAEAERALANRVAPLDLWLAQAPFVRRPLGASAPDEESAVSDAPAPPAVAPELSPAESEVVDQVLHDPSAFLDELGLLPTPDRDQELAELLDEAVRAGRTAEIVRTLRTTGDPRADAIVDRLELTSSSATSP